MLVKCLLDFISAVDLKDESGVVLCSSYCQQT